MLHRRCYRLRILFEQPHFFSIELDLLCFTCHCALSCRCNIPQKLSKSTLSLPCNHRTMTTAPPPCPSSRILKPSARPSSSPSFMSWSLFVGLVGVCCCFRLAARDQTFPLAKPTPVAMIGRYCHCRSSAWSVLSKRCEHFSTDISTVKEDSEGNGRRCFGNEEVPLATSFVVSIRQHKDAHSPEKSHSRY